MDVLLRTQHKNNKVTYFRLSDHPHEIDLPVEFGKGVVVKDTGSKVTVMTAGPILGDVLKAVRDLDINLIYFQTIKPIDTEIIKRYMDSKIIVIHDAFGLYESICEVPNLSVSYQGLKDEYISCYGTLNDIRKKIGIDIDSIRRIVQKELQM